MAGQDGTDVSVLVEIEVDEDIAAAEVLSVASALSAGGLTLDTDFDPVPIDPTKDQAVRMSQEKKRAVIIRGSIEESRIEELTKAQSVIRVWRDTPIAPFTMGHTDAVTPSRLDGNCPIPVCDCGFGNPAIGSIPEVATYLGVDQMWADGVKGCGIVIGIVDGGITAIGRPVAPGEVQNIPRVTGGWPANWGTTAAAWKDHGNMTAWDALGMAPGCNIFDIRISGGGGAVSQAIAGYQWAINRHRIDGTPHILSNSWGIYQKAWDPVYAEDPDHPFTRKVVEALNEGIIILFAAGNCGETCPDGRCGADNGPGRSIWGANGHPDVMTVGAVNLREQWVGYSSQGPAALSHNKPDFCSLTHFSGYFPNLNPARPSDTGTSAATPIAAGSVALLLQKNCNLTQSQIKELLMETAKDIGPLGWDRHSGAGIIQPKLAYDKITEPGPSPGPGLGRACLQHIFNAGVQLGWAEVYASYPGNQGYVSSMLSAAKAHAEAAEIFVAPSVFIDLAIRNLQQFGLTVEVRCIIRITSGILLGQLRNFQCANYKSAVLANIFSVGQILAWAHARKQFIDNGQSGEPISNIRSLLRGARAHALASNAFSSAAVSKIDAAISSPSVNSINDAREYLAVQLDSVCCEATYNTEFAFAELFTPPLGA